MPTLSKVASLLSLTTLGLAGTTIPNIIPLAVTGTLDGYALHLFVPQDLPDTFADAP
jgi:hypothetical protein